MFRSLHHVFTATHFIYFSYLIHARLQTSGECSREPLQPMSCNFQDPANFVIRKYERERKRLQRENQRMKVERGDHAANDEEKKKITFQIMGAFKSRTQGFSTETKLEIWSLVANHPHMREIHGQSSEDVAVQMAIVSNVRNTLATVKQPSSNEELFLKNAALQMLLNSKENMPISKVSRVLKVSRVAPCSRRDHGKRKAWCRCTIIFLGCMSQATPL